MDFFQYIYNESYIAFKPIWEEITVTFCSNPTIIAMVDKVAAVLQEKPELNHEDLEALLKDDIIDFDELIETIKQQYFEPFCEAFKAAKNADYITEEPEDRENFPEEEV